MRKLLAYPLSAMYYLCFGFLLVLFHGIQWLMLNTFGYNAHKKSVDILNAGLLLCLKIVGTRFTFINPYKIPQGVPCIIVANHQGQYDIPPIIWHLRHLHAKFISKKELGRGIPSISYNLRHGGSVLIDRHDKAQALKAIENMAHYCNKHQRSVVIFPEGTRSKDGIPLRFAPAGLQTLCDAMPEALIVPITIHNSWKLMRWGAFPVDHGVHVRHEVKKPFFVKEVDRDILVQKVEDLIYEDFNKIRERRS